MKTFLLAASVSLLAVSAASAQDWRASATQDLQAIHDKLRENHPAVVTGGDEAGFNQRLEQGLAAAQARVPQAVGSLGYAYLLRNYAYSLEDAGITIEPNWQAVPLWDGQLWAQFTTGWRNGGYEVTWVAPGVRNLPPLGARLVSCDDRTAEEFARARLDGWEGDLDRAADREQTAPYLFWNRANPFTPGLPQTCEFNTGGRRGRDYNITNAPAPEADRRTAWAATVYTAQTPVGVEAVTGGHWIHLHDLTENAGSEAFLAQLDSQLAAIQGGNVVIDLRGARAGAPGLGYSVANRLWSTAYRVSRQNLSGQIVYRVSPDNRQYFVDVLGRMQADATFAYYYPAQIQAMQDLIAQFDAAAAAGQQTFTQPITAAAPAQAAAEAAAETEAPAEGEAAVPAEPAAPAAPAAPTTNAMRGNVIVLVDGGCRNACLDVVDMLLTLPNVRVAGTPTGTDSIHFEPTRVALPSGSAYLNYGHKTWVGRTRPTNTGHVPVEGLAYTGNPTDEAAVRAWTLGLLGG